LVPSSSHSEVESHDNPLAIQRSLIIVKEHFCISRVGMLKTIEALLDASFRLSVLFNFTISSESKNGDHDIKFLS
jgi:hypothetical protein